MLFSCMPLFLFPVLQLCLMCTGHAACGVPTFSKQAPSVLTGLVDSLGFPDVSTISLERILGVSKLRENARKTHLRQAESLLFSCALGPFIRGWTGFLEEWNRDSLFPHWHPGVPGVKTPGNAHDRRPGIGLGPTRAPMETIETWAVAGRIWGYFSTSFFFVLTAMSGNRFAKEYSHSSAEFLFCLESCRFLLVLLTPPPPFKIMPVIVYLILPSLFPVIVYIGDDFSLSQLSSTSSQFNMSINFSNRPLFLPKGRRWFNISIWIYLSTFPCQFFSIKLVSHQACLHQTYHLKLISAKPIWFCFQT